MKQRKVVKTITYYDDGSFEEIYAIQEPTKPTNPWIKTNTCPQCGIELYQNMGYYCPSVLCPCGLGSSTVIGIAMNEWELK